MKITIYAVLHPETEVCLSNIRYVGLTKKAIDKRLAEHVYEANYPKRNKSHRTHWFKSLADEGLYPVIYPLEVVDEEAAPLCEQQWIARLRLLGCQLVNGTEGGETSRQTAESRAKMSAALKGRPGRVWTDEERQKLSASNSVSIKFKFDTDPEYRERHRTGCKNRPPMSMERRQKLSDDRKGQTNKGHHTRWHLNRGIVKDDCQWCEV